MAELTIDLTYGKALFDASVDIDKTDDLWKEALDLENLFKSEPEFYAFVNSPVISATEKKAVINNVLQNQLSEEMKNFLCVLIDKGRTRHFPKIVQRFQQLINDHNGFTSGEIYSVHELDNMQLKSFEEKAGNLLKKKIKLINKLDPKIIGGVRIFIDGKVIDATIKNRLNQMSESLR